MDLCLISEYLLKLCFSFYVNISDSNRVKIMSIPVLFCGFVFEYFLVHLHFIFMELKVTVVYHVIVSLSSCLNSFSSNSILLGRLGAFLRGLEMVFTLVNIADDIVVYKGVFSGSEVPRLLLRVVWPIFKSFQFVFEVEYVVRLLIAKGFVFVLCKSLDHVLLFMLFHLSFASWVSELLSDWVVLNLLFLDVLTGYLVVWLSLALKVLLSCVVLTDILFPSGIAVIKTYGVTCICKSVTHLH